MSDYKLNGRNKKGLYCNNCGKTGHYSKNCNDPTTSLGIINIKISPELIQEKNLDQFLIKKFHQEDGSNEGYKEKNSKLISIRKDNNENLNNFSKVKKYINQIKFLLIRRKFTLGYLEFIRGRYEVDDMNHIVSLFKQMTTPEIKMIAKSKFEDLWNRVWKSSSYNKNFEFEFEVSKAKFYQLKNDPELIINLEHYVKKVKPEYEYPEWGFPKGRRNYYESNLECAVREFGEETGLEDEDYLILNKINPLQEVFQGTNDVWYKHIYFMAVNDTKKKAQVEKSNTKQYEEIGDIGWFTYEEAMKLIRPYHTEKKDILMEVLLFLINCITKC